VRKRTKPRCYPSQWQLFLSRRKTPVTVPLREPSPYIQRFMSVLEDTPMNTVIYVVGLVVIIGLVLGFLGFR
jgi:hypothetical protein